MDIGSNLSKARKLRGLSQEEVANTLGVSRQCISLWETDQTVPTLDNLTALSEALNVPISVLMGQMPFPSEETVVLDENFNNYRLEKNQKLAKNLSIIAFVLSFFSCFTFLIPGLGLFISLAVIVLSITAKKKETTKLNTFSLIFGCVYFFASIVTLVGMDYIQVLF